MGAVRAITFAIAAGLSGLSLSACATGAGIAQAAAPTVFTQAPAPQQFRDFCARHPAECAGIVGLGTEASAPLIFRTSGSRTAPAQRLGRYDWSLAFATPTDRVYEPKDYRPSISDRGILTRLAGVNREVNAAVRFRSDDQLFGAEDVWSLPVPDADGLRWGDCEDYALMKRSILISEGFDPRALSLAVVRTQRNEIHAVLLVATAEGEVVLDSLSDRVGPWAESRYVLIARQAAGDPSTWIQPS